jgi:hypothetical protein
MAQGATDYGQLFVALNNVYLYPGTSSIFDPTRLFPFLLILAFFYFLFRFNMRSRRRSRPVQKSGDADRQAEGLSGDQTNRLPANNENNTDTGA